MVMNDIYVLINVLVGFILIIAEANIVEYDWNKLFYDEEEDDAGYRGNE